MAKKRKVVKKVGKDIKNIICGGKSNFDGGEYERKVCVSTLMLNYTSNTVVNKNIKLCTQLLGDISIFSNDIKMIEVKKTNNPTHISNANVTIDAFKKIDTSIDAKIATVPNSKSVSNKYPIIFIEKETRIIDYVLKMGVVPILDVQVAEVMYQLISSFSTLTEIYDAAWAVAKSDVNNYVNELAKAGGKIFSLLPNLDEVYNQTMWAEGEVKKCANNARFEVYEEATKILFKSLKELGG